MTSSEIRRLSSSSETLPGSSRIWLTNVIALEMTLDRVGETAAAPVVDVDDFAATATHRLMQPIDAVANRVVTDARAEDHD